MRPPSVRDLVKLNVFVGSLLIIFAAVAFWLSFEWGDLADRYKSRPELIPDSYFSQGKYDMLRDTAVDCYRLQDELHVASLRGTAKYSMDATWILAGLGALFLLNAWSFRKFFHAIGTSRSNH